MPKDSYQGRSLFCPNNAFFQILYDKLDVVNLSSATPDDLHGLNHRLIIYAYSIILEFREQIAANNYQKLIAELKKIDEFLCNIYGHIQQYTFKCLPGTLKDFRRKTSPDAYWNFLFITAHLLARCKALSAGLVCKEWGAINPLIESVDFFYNNFLGMLDGHASHCDPLHPRLDASQRAQQDPDFVQHQRRVTDTYPECIDHRPPYIMPDLHGNALLFIYYLLLFKVADISVDQYVRLRDIYNSLATMQAFSAVINYENMQQKCYKLQIRLMHEFVDIVSSSLQVRDDFSLEQILILIGDFDCDRGVNDILVYLVLSVLQRQEIKISILESNHGSMLRRILTDIAGKFALTFEDLQDDAKFDEFYLKLNEFFMDFDAPSSSSKINFILNKLSSSAGWAIEPVDAIYPGTGNSTVSFFHLLFRGMLFNQNSAGGEDFAKQLLRIYVQQKLQIERASQLLIYSPISNIVYSHAPAPLQMFLLLARALFLKTGREWSLLPEESDEQSSVYAEVSKFIKKLSESDPGDEVRSIFKRIVDQVNAIYSERDPHVFEDAELRDMVKEFVFARQDGLYNLCYEESDVYLDSDPAIRSIEHLVQDMFLQEDMSADSPQRFGRLTNLKKLSSEGIVRISGHDGCTAGLVVYCRLHGYGVQGAKSRPTQMLVVCDSKIGYSAFGLLYRCNSDGVAISAVGDLCRDYRTVPMWVAEHQAVFSVLGVRKGDFAGVQLLGSSDFATSLGDILLQVVRDVPQYGSSGAAAKASSLPPPGLKKPIARYGAATKASSSPPPGLKKPIARYGTAFGDAVDKAAAPPRMQLVALMREESTGPVSLDPYSDEEGFGTAGEAANAAENAAAQSLIERLHCVGRKAGDAVGEADDAAGKADCALGARPV